MAPAPIRIRAAEAISTVSGHLLEASKVLLTRDDDKDDDKSDRHKPTVDPDSGSFDPHNISNAGFFFLFALIGVAFVAGGIWFFFWAKNGGFHFRETDWDDYKSTVLRRTGPNGTILSNATRPTNLGGGSVYKDVADDDTHLDHNDDGQTVITEATGLSGITAGASDIYSREKRRRKQEKRDRERVKKGKKAKHRFVGEDGVEDEDAERSAKKELRSYRHEKAARVGGINKESEGSQWDGSTNPTESNVSTTLLSDRQTTPTTTPTKPSGGIRKVYSVADRRADREQERMRAEARRLREAGRAARRDYNYQRAESYTRAESQATESLLDGSQVTRTTGDSGSDLGTKSYHHPMPELRELERERAREERRARRAERGYRRSRQEEVD